MRVAFASARSAPGVTTATVAFASVLAGRVLIVEASEDGGVLAARYGLTLEPGVTTLAAASRHDPDPSLLWAHTQALPDTDDRIVALVGPPAAEAAQLVWRTGGERLAGMLADIDDVAVLIDAGRLPPSSAAAPLIAKADRLVVVVQPRVDQLQALTHRLPALRDLADDLDVLLVGDQPYGPAEVATTLDVPVLGVLADDRAAADALAGVGSARRLGRSLLLRSAASLVGRLEGSTPIQATRPTPDMPPTSTWTAQIVSPKS